MKSLGLNSGKAILRLIYRDPEQLKTQAHVSSILLPKSVVDKTSSNENCPQRVPLSIPHCSKTLDSSINVSNVENQKSEAKIDEKDERVNVLDNKEQETNICTIKESHAAASNQKKSHENRRDQCSTEANTKVQEDVYEVKFVRCNCADVQSYSNDTFTYC